MGDYFFKNSRGMATIVTTLIIILLVLVSTGIIWGVTRGVIEKAKTGIELGKTTVSLEIKKVQAFEDQNESEVVVKRNQGKGNIQKLRFLFTDCLNSEVHDADYSLKELEEKQFLFMLDNLKPFNVRKVVVVPILGGEGDEAILGRESVYEIGSCEGYSSSSEGNNPPINELIIEDAYYLLKWNSLNELVESIIFEDNEGSFFGIGMYNDPFSVLFYEGYGSLWAFNDGFDFLIENYQGRVLIGDAFDSSSQAKLIIDAPNNKFSFMNGNVGIGTENPHGYYDLDILGNGAIRLGIEGESGVSKIVFSRPDSPQASEIQYIHDDHQMRFLLENTPVFWVKKDPLAAQGDFIIDSKSVGIGVNYPSYTLDVSGFVHASEGFVSGENEGLTGTYNVGSCTMSFDAGIISDYTC
ncbi:MAG: hypothetical protein KC516_02605 [Nanoarchaeota archaeon]|nr:hypothetical protein [Nanoarchaeota archaeon]